ncbi:hypothetical protein OH77DRAFT_1420685 [Trametes cingulata]|nr:hypothetical protein OH77DRAFT_1420685 [Trametes cingulata]
MTSSRDAQSIEARKARYSRELAAYTLRQWDLVRQSMEDGGNRDKSATPPTSGRSRSVPRDSGRSSRIQGIHAHDYAHSPHRQMSSSRAVAGNA